MVSFVPREANQIADRIDKMASANVEEVNVLTAPPEDVLEVTASDKASGK